MGDYINRDQAVRELVLDYAYVAADIIKKVPAADVREVVHGYWHDVFQDGPCSWSGVCSVCDVRNDIPPLPQAHFCPNCGAKMDKE